MFVTLYQMLGLSWAQAGVGEGRYSFQVKITKLQKACGWYDLTSNVINPALESESEQVSSEF